MIFKNNFIQNSTKLKSRYKNSRAVQRSPNNNVNLRNAIEVLHKTHSVIFQ